MNTTTDKLPDGPLPNKLLKDVQDRDAPHQWLVDNITEAVETFVNRGQCNPSNIAMAVQMFKWLNRRCTWGDEFIGIAKEQVVETLLAQPSWFIAQWMDLMGAMRQTHEEIPRDPEQTERQPRCELQDDAGWRSAIRERLEKWT